MGVLTPAFFLIWCRMPLAGPRSPDNENDLQERWGRGSTRRTRNDPSDIGPRRASRLVRKIMKNRALRKVSSTILAGLLSTWAVACTQGGEDDGFGGDAATGGNDSGEGSGGKKGSGGNKATGGGKGSGGDKATGGSKSTGGSENAGGQAGSDNAGSGGQGGDPAVGTGGEASGTGGEASGTGGETNGGTGGASSGPLAIEKSHQFLLPQFSDVRGLSYGAGGKLYVSGYITVESDRMVAVARVLPNGDLDDTFGDEGIASWNIVERELDEETVVVDGVEDSYGAVELGSGDLLVQFNARQADNSGNYVGVLRVDSSGEPVTTFGQGGLVQAQFGYESTDESATWSDSGWGIALDTVTTPGTEKVVIFGFGTAPAVTTRTDNDRYVTRLLAEDGSVDPSFNGGAAFTFHSEGTLSDGGRRGLVLADGSILSSGYTNFPEAGGNHVLLIKLTPAGVPDSTFGFGFGQGGVAKFNPFGVDGGVSECYATAVQSTGRLVTTGYGTATGVSTASTLGYFTSVKQDLVSFGVLSGGLDPTFANDGHLAVQSEDDPPEEGLEALAAERFEERGRDIIALSDDRVVHAGRYDLRPALMIGRKNGGLDETVGDSETGRFLYSAVTADTAHFYSIALSKDGSRVAAATSGGAPEGVLIAVLRVGDE